MKRALFPVLLAMTGCQPVYLASIPPVCSRPEVVGFLDAQLRKQDPYEEILPDTVAERTAPGGQSVCGAYARHLAFDTRRFGSVPAASVRQVSYTVREAANGGGLVVAVLPGMR